MLKTILLLSLLVSALFSVQTVDLDLGGTTYTVELEENKQLNALSKTSAFFYKGSIQLDQASWVRLSFKNRRWKGTAFILGTFYTIDQPSAIENFQAASNGFFKPDAKIVDKIQSKKMDLSELEGKACGLNSAVYTPSAESLTTSLGFDASFTPELAEANTASVLDLEIALDHFFIGNLGEDVAIEEALGIINSLDGVYTKEFGISINLVKINTFLSDSTDPLTNSLDNDVLIVDVRTQGNAGTLFHHSTVSLEHLITGRDIDGGVIGVAYVGTNCDTSYSYGFSQRFGDSTFLVMAHEIGHSLGADHDTVAGGDGESCSAGFLMEPYINGSDSFSSCSKDSMLNASAGSGGGLNSSCVKSAMDISIEQSSPVLNQLEKGRELTETYLIKNLSALTVTNFFISAELNSGISLLSASIGANICTVTSTSYSCEISSINALSTLELSVQFQATQSAGTATLSHLITQPQINFADTQLINNVLNNSYELASILSPSSLTAQANANSITLNWVDNSFIETQYQLEKSLDNLTWTTIANLIENETTFIDTDTSLGVEYFYRVRATNSTQISSYSNITQAILDQMQRPQNFRIKRIR